MKSGKPNSTDDLKIFGHGNGSPMATNAVVVVGTCCYYQIFDVLKLFHFTVDRN